MKKLNLSPRNTNREIDPLKIFEQSVQRGLIENLWAPQADALSRWNESRSNSDIFLQMNTGGGKTLVGLLIAQSLVHETNGQVLYLCPNNQLIEQTKEKASAIGLSPATYSSRNWNEEALKAQFDSGKTFCLTNYDALFNGKSIFRERGCKAFVFDDAHVAGNIIRKSFTVTIEKSKQPQQYTGILDLFTEYFTRTARTEILERLKQGNSATNLVFIPTFEIETKREKFYEFVEFCTKDPPNVFPWEHLKDNLRLCSVLVDHSKIEISPPVLPLFSLAAFNDDIRRVYLTATLPSLLSLQRIFNVTNPTVITPEGKSGAAQRLFVFVPGETFEEKQENVKKLTETQKCLLISPSKSDLHKWPEFNVLSTEGSHQQIKDFSTTVTPEKLGMAARYDGVDFPGNACNVLIIDRIPQGENLFDRFLDEHLGVLGLRNTLIATRITQAIGRIFRSNTDHGVVLLVDEKLQVWMRNNDNRSILPSLIQQQIQISEEFEQLIRKGETTWEECIKGVLTGDPGWDETYKDAINNFKPQLLTDKTSCLVEASIREYSAFRKLWEGQFVQAAELYHEASTHSTDSNIEKEFQAWLLHWEGYSYMLAERNQDAQSAFLNAANRKAVLGRPPMSISIRHGGSISPQVKKAVEYYRQHKNKFENILMRIKSHLKNVGQHKEANLAAEAVKDLGLLLGLEASRPDTNQNETQSTLDALWENNGAAIGFELKTNKGPNTTYSKAEVNQSLGHFQWLKRDEQFINKSRKIIIVGPCRALDPLAHPDNRLSCSDISLFVDLLNRFRNIFEAVKQTDKDNIENVFQGGFEDQGLLFPACIDSGELRLLSDLEKKT